MTYNDIYYQKLLDSEAEMGEVDKAIEDAMGELALNEDGRKDLEKLYERRIYLQYIAARTFHPFSEFGKLCLRRAQEIADEYENEFGLLTTRITKDNLDRFKGSLTLDLMDDISTGKCQAIGALRYDEDGISGVGALVYMVDTDRLDDEYILIVKWLFVKEGFRNRGVGTSLLGGLLGKSLVLENNNVLFEIPAKQDLIQPYYKLLSDWHFDFEAGLAPQLFLKMSDVEILDELLDLAGNVKPLKKLSSDRREALSGRFPTEYFDEELSCFIAKGDDVLGVLLVHRLPSGKIRMERMVGDPKFGENLFSYMIISAKEICGDDTMVELFAQSQEMGDYFDVYYSTHLRTLVMLASLQKPYGISDTKVEDAIGVLSA
jgi:hypothetical protein